MPAKTNRVSYENSKERNEDDDLNETDNDMEEDGIDVYLQRFDPSKMKRDAFVAVIGKRRIGKTTIMENLGHALKFPRAIALCGSMGSMLHFRKFIPECYVHPATIEILRFIIAERKKMVEANPDLPAEQLETLLYIDDMAFVRKFMYSEEMKQLAMNGRWLFFCVIVSVQYLMEMSPALRQNLDYILVTRELSRVNRRKLWENWGACCPTLDHFGLFLEKCTNKHGCLVLDATVDTTKMDEVFSHYRANPSLGQWCLGDEAFRRHHVLLQQRLAAAKRSQAAAFSNFIPPPPPPPLPVTMASAVGQTEMRERTSEYHHRKQPTVEQGRG